MKIDGIKELRRALSRLPEELQASSERTALREGMKPVLKGAKTRAVEDSGLLKKSLGITVKKSRKRGGILTARCGPRSGFGKMVLREKRSQNGSTTYKLQYADPSKYANLVEYGTSKKPARPFIRPATQSAKSQIAEGLRKGYAKGLERAIRRVKSRI